MRKKGLEPLRLSAIAPHHHYSFRYQLVCFVRSADNLRTYNHPWGDKPSYTNCLWPGLSLHHIEILQDIISFCLPTIIYVSNFLKSSIFTVSFVEIIISTIGAFRLVSTHCLKIAAFISLNLTAPTHGLKAAIL